ncbi:DUF1737 domain-containing protein [Candidatus Pacearchaeota archaeon]|nr:DUF1737 domain-containing protein [Candidatus Pacearchaeota archaeon]
MMKYKILMHSDSETLEKTVDEHLKVGFQLHGSAFASVTGLFCQPVISLEPDVEEPA